MKYPMRAVAMPFTAMSPAVPGTEMCSVKVRRARNYEARAAGNCHFKNKHIQHYK